MECQPLSHCTGASHAWLAAVTAPGKPRPIYIVRSSLPDARNSIKVRNEVLLH